MGMAVMEHPPQSFGEPISRIDDARDVVKDDVLLFLPVLDGKELDVDMTTAFGGDAVVDDVDGRLVVLMQNGGVVLSVTQLMQDGPKIEDSLCCRDRRDEFSFSGTCRSDTLCFTPVGNWTTGKGNVVASGCNTRLE